MKKKNKKMNDLLIKPDITIQNAMKILDQTGKKCLLVIDENNKLLGTLTDGDLRRSLLSGEKFNSNISKSYFKTPIVLFIGEYKMKDIKKILSKNDLALIPIVDRSFIVKDYLYSHDIINTNKKENDLREVPVIIMAGGRGTRMEPFTDILPKPLIPIQGKSIIEIIIESFTQFKCSDFYLTINYKGKILKAFFEELQPSYSINFIEEDKPLGTAGSLFFLKNKLNKPFFVTNCDITIKSNYSSIYDFHMKRGYSITIVASTKEYIIPYGTCELDIDGDLKKINEKPQFDFLINTGLYVVNPKVLSYIPEGKYFDITELIEILKKNDEKIGVFPIHEDNWVDVGQWSEYKKAINKI